MATRAVRCPPAVCRISASARARVFPRAAVARTRSVLPDKPASRTSVPVRPTRWRAKWAARLPAVAVRTPIVRPAGAASNRSVHARLERICAVTAARRMSRPTAAGSRANPANRLRAAPRNASKRAAPRSVRTGRPSAPARASRWAARAMVSVPKASMTAMGCVRTTRA
jgi:hypothetical protein